MISDKQRELLESFRVDKDLKELEEKLAEFNIFKAIGVVEQEIRHSNFLAFLLDPSQNHKLDDVFLKEFLKQVLLATDNPTDPINHANIDIANLRYAKVSREKHDIDILIHSRQNKLVCVIENKIRSGERPNQLKKYEETINRHYKDCQAIFIYLNPEGSLPSETNWRIYDYYKVVEIIDSIRRKYKYLLERDLYTLMTHYSKLIRRDIVSDSEIAKLCREIYFEHRQAINLIIKHSQYLQSEIDVEIQKLLNPRIIESKGIFAHFHPPKGVPKCSNFGAEDWEKSESKFLIFFQFKNIPDSLKMRLQIGHYDHNPGERPRKIRPKLFELLQNQHYSKFLDLTNIKLGNDEITLYEEPILEERDYKNPNIEEIREKIQNFWEHFSKHDFVDITQMISENIEMILKDN